MNPFLILFLEKRLSLSLVYTMIYEKSIEKEEFDKISRTFFQHISTWFDKIRQNQVLFLVYAIFPKMSIIL